MYDVNRYVVWLLEQGRKRYGVGSHRQICVIVDRSSEPGEVAARPKSLTIMLPLLRNLFSTLQVSMLVVVAVFFPLLLFFFKSYNIFICLVIIVVKINHMLSIR